MSSRRTPQEQTPNPFHRVAIYKTRREKQRISVRKREKKEREMGLTAAAHGERDKGKLGDDVVEAVVEKDLDGSDRDDVADNPSMTLFVPPTSATEGIEDNEENEGNDEKDEENEENGEE
ncbi:hypothetical protein Droror1_Dr00008329 [Drosera rotundifolia]